MHIYKITNKVTNEFYIGKTTKTPDIRWYFHKKDCEYGRNPKSRLYRAIRKYGEDQFVVESIATCDSVEDLNNLEIKLISEMSPSYNIAKGGDGGWINDQTGKTWKVKDSSRMGGVWRGRNRPLETVELITGGKNYQSTHFIDTPWGVFETYRDAVNKAKELRKSGNGLVVTDINTLKIYCEGCTLNKEGRRTNKEWRGKHTNDLGFGRRIKVG